MNNVTLFILTRMKYFIHILITFIALLVVGCQNETGETRLMDQAERLFDAYPDSSITVLDSIPLPEEMSPRLVARWCMLYARAADKIEDEMPYTNQLEIALTYYQTKNMREEEAEIGLYLGRSFVEDKQYEKAILAYSDALEVALAIKSYNRAGYISSYMGDLYELDDRFILAAEKNRESGRYFLLANNLKSYVRAFVNEGRSYMATDSNYLALTALKQAEVIMDSLHVEEVRDYVYNGLGNVYNYLGKYDLAAYYILQCIELDPEETASDYLVLVDISYKRMDWEKVEYYLTKANIPTDNEYVLLSIAYYNYMVRKERGDLSNALAFYEQYVAISDSFMRISKSVDIYDTGQKYEHVKLHNQNVKLLLKNQRYYVFVFSLLFVSALLIIIYLVTLRKKNHSIWISQQEINALNRSIYQLYVELQGRKDELSKLQIIIQETERPDNLSYPLEEELAAYEKVKEEVECLRSQLISMRETRILHSSLAKKIKALSQTVQPNVSEAPISDKMWTDIECLMMEVYPDVLKVLRDAGLSSSEMHLCFLTLFKLDTKAISILLNIIPTSVDRSRLRVRKKLLWEGKQELYESLVSI